MHITSLPHHYSTDLIKERVLSDRILHLNPIGFIEEVGEEKYSSVIDEINRDFIAITATDDHLETEKPESLQKKKDIAWQHYI